MEQTDRVTATEGRDRNISWVDVDRAFKQAADKALYDLAFGVEVSCAGMLLRDADLEDIAHYFEYTADNWAKHILGL